MKITVIPSFYPNKYNTEQAIFIKEQVKHLVVRGHDVAVISPQLRYVTKPSNRIKNETLVEKQDGAIVIYKFINVYVPSKVRSITNYLYDYVLESLFQYYLKDYGLPDVLYAHFSFPGGFAATRLSQKYNIPLVTEEHFSDLMFPVDRCLRNIVRSTIRNSRFFLCVSSGLKQSLISQLGSIADSCIVATNMINECFIYQPQVKKSEFHFFSLGNIVYRKGFDLLIKAFLEEFSEESNVKLIIAGDGPEKSKLQAYVNQNCKNDKVFFIGHLNRAETMKYYTKTDCFVLPSRAETFGLVYREALAVGRPIISTKHGGFTAQDWHSEYGHLINIDDIDALKTSMRDIYVNYKNFDLEKISKICLSTCAPNVVMRQIEKYLSIAINKFNE